MNLAEQYRELVLNGIFGVASFTSAWPARKAFITTVLGAPTGWAARDIVGLGSQMRDLFVLGAPPPGTGRTQGALSSAGTVWEALVTYYLNLCYAGTDTVAIRKSEVPAYIATAPKSNKSGQAYWAAVSDVEAKGALPVPLHRRNAAHRGMK